MKGPSLDAIRKFKRLQEEKKRLETEQKVKEKLTTLEHRASRGDKKAKTQLKQIEKIEEERSKAPEPAKRNNSKPFNSKGGSSYSHSNSAEHGTKSSFTRPKSSGFDFDELMKLAANNTNEVKQEEKKEPALKARRHLERQKPCVLPTHREHPVVSQTKSISRELPPTPARISTQPKASISMKMQPSASKVTPTQAPRPVFRHPVSDRSRPRLQPFGREYYDDEDEDEDEYESDGFVVDDEDDRAREELDATLRSVFRYDKRRCDLREQQLERLDRAIGRVSTFEDLEREERRASRLAAAEDAEALRDLEERKRLKKQRLKEMRR